MVVDRLKYEICRHVNQQVWHQVTLTWRTQVRSQLDYLVSDQIWDQIWHQLMNQISVDLCW